MLGDVPPLEPPRSGLRHAGLGSPVLTWTGAAARRRPRRQCPVGLDDDVAELFRRCQPAERVDGQLERLAGGAGGWPIRPAGASRFWWRIAAATSPALIP